MLFGAMFIRDLRRSSRNPGDSAIRVGVGLWLLVILSVQVLGWRAQVREPSHAQLASFARLMIGTSVVGQGLALATITPAIVGGTIAEMRSRKILDLLLCSRMSGFDIVGGIYLARLVRLLSFLMIGLPIQFLICMFGGLDASIVLLAFMVSASILAFLGACSLVASLLVESAGEAVALSYVMTIAWLGLPPLIEGPVRSSWPTLHASLGPITRFLGIANPLTSLSRPADAWMVLSATMLGLSIGLMIAVALAFRPIARKEFVLARRTASIRRRPPIPESPVLWKETYTRPSSGMFSRVASLVLRSFLVVIAILTMRFLARIAFQPAAGIGSVAESMDFLRFLRVVTSCLIIVGLTAVTSHAASSITIERERTTWLSLIACPLDGPEILAGKRSGVLSRIRWIEYALLVLWFSGVLGGVISIVSCVISIATTWVAFRFAAALGVLISLESRSSTRSMVVALLILLMMQGGYLLCCIPIPGLSSVVLFGCTPLLNEMSLAGSGVIPGMSGFLPSRVYQELPFTAVVSCVVYRLSHLAINLIAETDFDNAVDRPSRPQRTTS